jgi:peptide/nickel transport system substrate-binding protein
MVNKTIDIGTPQNNTGKDILGNIYEWKRINENKTS